MPEFLEKEVGENLKNAVITKDLEREVAQTPLYPDPENKMKHPVRLGTFSSWKTAGLQGNMD